MVGPLTKLGRKLRKAPAKHSHRVLGIWVGKSRRKEMNRQAANNRNQPSGVLLSRSG
ncbi:hypothetical protein [Lacticaseibacillus nasuensis]|uniref:Uncharacterized protein n=1 Tax=Lacticaseibacillus nasuensis JCM 17158 TaxID=1291734 RepID=A0A0R1JVU2_9LACO|nr:hypothetical protein [Lacticaseibacillus nasuensis]KRK73363.1 hypothetical protein FD02_GL001221 [Lacticaseibacillus nasuensis JCM 17158]